MAVATEEVSRSGEAVIALPVVNPVVPVYDSDGKLLGSGNVEGVLVKLHLDRNRPETFDFEVQPETLRGRIVVYSMKWGAHEGYKLEFRIILEGH
jgi:hypothetical protein